MRAGLGTVAQYSHQLGEPSSPRWVIEVGDLPWGLRLQQIQLPGPRNRLVPVWHGVDLVDQGDQELFQGRRLRGLQRDQQALPYTRVNLLERRDQVSQKARRVVVPFSC